MRATTRRATGVTRLFPPLDRRLKIPRRGASARLQRKVCEANLAGSFPKAARLLKSLARLPMDDKQVQLITERVGRVLEEERGEATEAFLERRAAAPKAKPPALLVITLDGGRVQTRQPDPGEKWKEDKVGVVYEAVPSPEEPGREYAGPAPLRRAITATMENWDTLGDHLSALADRRGYARAKDKVCLSDGAGSLASQRERCFADAVFILDHAHAVEHLHQTAQAAFGAGAKADAWWDSQKDRLWNGRLTPLLAEIARLSRRAGAPPKKASETDPRRLLANNLSYFKTHRQGMDYPTFRKNGWPIGSGIVESVIKQLGRRLKGTEKHWAVSGAEATLQVMTRLLSEDGSWNDFWKRGPLAA
jgi:hypothetical protein